MRRRNSSDESMRANEAKKIFTGGFVDNLLLEDNTARWVPTTLACDADITAFRCTLPQIGTIFAGAPKGIAPHVAVATTVFRPSSEKCIRVEVVVCHSHSCSVNIECNVLEAVRRLQLITELRNRRTRTPPTRRLPFPSPPLPFVNLQLVVWRNGIVPILPSKAHQHSSVPTHR